jgi:hypothetical protein
MDNHPNGNVKAAKPVVGHINEVILSLLQKGRRAIFVCESGRELAKRYRITAICQEKHRKRHQNGKELFAIFENRVSAVES